MKKSFMRNLLIVGSLHLALVAGLALVALLHGCRRSQPAALAYMPVEFVAEVPKPAPTPPPPAPSPAPAPATRKTPPVRKKRTPKRRTPRASQAEIQKMLDLDTKAVTDAEPLKNDAMYRTLIYQTYRSAWQPPSYSEVGDAIALVSLYLREDGTLIRYDLKSSGNELLDTSVRKALRSVGRVPGLSRDYIARNKVIPIQFQAERDQR